MRITDSELQKLKRAPILLLSVFEKISGDVKRSKVITWIKLESLLKLFNRKLLLSGVPIVRYKVIAEDRPTRI